MCTHTGKAVQCSRTGGKPGCAGRSARGLVRLKQGVFLKECREQSDHTQRGQWESNNQCRLPGGPPALTRPCKQICDCHCLPVTRGMLESLPRLQTQHLQHRAPPFPLAPHRTAPPGPSALRSAVPPSVQGLEQTTWDLLSIPYCSPGPKHNHHLVLLRNLHPKCVHLCAH